METRQLGNTPLKLTEIGFGAWAIGGGDWAFGWGSQDDADSIRAIHKALDLGVNWIDTAAVYGLGHSERIVARAIEGKRNDIILATKCSLVWDDSGAINSSLLAQSVRDECEASLKRLNTNVIDIYQIHWPNDDENIEEGWEEIGRLIDEGKVRFGGVSNFRTKHMVRAQAINNIASLQPPYSMLRRAIEKSEMKYCRTNEIGIVAYSPMQSGLLTGKFDRSRLNDNDWRAKAGEFNEPNLSINLAFAKSLAPIAAKYDKTIAQLALAWVLRKQDITSAIVGARRPSQVEEIVGGTGWKIEMEDLDLIEELLERRLNNIRKMNGYLNPIEEE